MANESTVAALWRKLDAHDELIHTTQREQAAMHARLDALEQRTDRMLVAVSESRAEAKHSSDLLSDKIDALDKHVQQTKGGLRLGAWIVGAVSGVSALAGAVWASAKGFFQ